MKYRKAGAQPVKSREREVKEWRELLGIRRSPQSVKDLTRRS